MFLDRQGLGPLRYQWFKDSRRLTVATSNSPLLILVDVGAADSGSYHCQVSNKDGAVTSSKALLNINRVGRMQHATTLAAGEGLHNTAGSPEPASASVSLICCTSWRLLPLQTQHCHCIESFVTVQAAVCVAELCSCKGITALEPQNICVMSAAALSVQHFEQAQYSSSYPGQQRRLAIQPTDDIWCRWKHQWHQLRSSITAENVTSHTVALG